MDKTLITYTFCLIIFLVGCKIDKNSRWDNTSREKIFGRALNIEKSAGVVTESGTVYFIEGMSSWASELLNEEVVVYGKKSFQTRFSIPKDSSNTSITTTPEIYILKPIDKPYYDKIKKVKK